LTRKEDIPDELSSGGKEVSADDKNWNPVILAKRLILDHFVHAIDLQNGSSFVDKGAFVNLCGVVVNPVESFRFLQHRDGLTRQCALVNECTAFQNDALKGDFGGVFQEDDVSWDYFPGRKGVDLAVSEHIHSNFVVGHFEDMLM